MLICRREESSSRRFPSEQRVAHSGPLQRVHGPKGRNLPKNRAPPMSATVAMKLGSLTTRKIPRMGPASNSSVDPRTPFSSRLDCAESLRESSQPDGLALINTSVVDLPQRHHRRAADRSTRHRKRTALPALDGKRESRAQCLPPLCRLDDYPPPYEAVRPPPPSITTTPAQQPAAKEIESLTCDEWFFANNDERQLPQPSRAGPDDPGRLSAEPTQPHTHRDKRARFSHDSCEMV